MEEFTPAARELITLHGALEAFDAAADKTLPLSANLKVSASTVQRVTEGVRADLSRLRAAGETFGGSRRWDWQRDAAGALRVRSRGAI